MEDALPQSRSVEIVNPSQVDMTQERVLLPLDITPDDVRKEGCRPRRTLVDMDKTPWATEGVFAASDPLTTRCHTQLRKLSQEKVETRPYAVSDFFRGTWI